MKLNSSSLVLISFLLVSCGTSNKTKSTPTAPIEATPAPGSAAAGESHEIKLVEIQRASAAVTGNVRFRIQGFTPEYLKDHQSIYNVPGGGAFSECGTNQGVVYVIGMYIKLKTPYEGNLWQSLQHETFCSGGVTQPYPSVAEYVGIFSRLFPTNAEYLAGNKKGPLLPAADATYGIDKAAGYYYYMPLRTPEGPFEAFYFGKDGKRYVTIDEVRLNTLSYQ